jgi:uncharacterized protein (DUF1330 family)
MSEIKSNDTEFRRLARNQDTGPVVMLNLLKFKPGGAADYDRYSQFTLPVLTEIGAKVLFIGKANELLQGDETWDYVLLIEYPSRKTFLTMISNPEYLKAHEWRLKACERAVLYATDPARYIDRDEK